MKTPILYLTTDSQIGGTEKNILVLLKYLDKKHYSPSLWTLKGDGPLLKESQKLGIPGFSLQLERGKVFRLFRLYLFLLRKRPKIIHTFLYQPNLLGRLFGKLTRAPLIINSLRSTDDWRKPWHWFIDRITSPFSTLIISNSQAGRGVLLNKGFKKGKLMVIESGVEVFSSKINKEEARKNLRFSKDTLLIGSLGNLKKAKGYPYLISAFSFLLKDFPGSYLLISGDGKSREKKKLKKLVKTLGIEENVSFLGFQKDIKTFLPALDIFVLSSLWEGMPLSLLEAMSFSLPVVATKVGGVGEIVREGEEGFLVPPGDVHSLVSAVASLLKNPLLRERMGRASRERVEKDFSLQKMVTRTFSVYKRIDKGGAK